MNDNILRRVEQACTDLLDTGEQVTFTAVAVVSFRRCKRVSKRKSPVQRLQAEIDEVFAGGEDLAGAIEQVAVLGARLLLQTAIEAEVSAFLGRKRYERATAGEDARARKRNGYCPTTMKPPARCRSAGWRRCRRGS